MSQVMVHLPKIETAIDLGGTWQVRVTWGALTKELTIPKSIMDLHPENLGEYITGALLQIGAEHKPYQIVKDNEKTDEGSNG